MTAAPAPIASPAASAPRSTVRITSREIGPICAATKKPSENPMTKAPMTPMVPRPAKARTRENRPSTLARMADGGARSSLRVREPVADDLGARRKDRETNLPAVRSKDGDLRRYLPGVEPDRRLNDWGRSERIENLMDKTLVDFYYRYWFRADVEGIENIPSSGGALLVSNHAGALPPDATMIAKAIKEEHPHPRPLNITVEHFFKYPL